LRRHVLAGNQVLIVDDDDFALLLVLKKSEESKEQGENPRKRRFPVLEEAPSGVMHILKS